MPRKVVSLCHNSSDLSVQYGIIIFSQTKLKNMLRKGKMEGMFKVCKDEGKEDNKNVLAVASEEKQDHRSPFQTMPLYCEDMVTIPHHLPGVKRKNITVIVVKNEDKQASLHS